MKCGCGCGCVVGRGGEAGGIGHRRDIDCHAGNAGRKNSTACEKIRTKYLTPKKLELLEKYFPSVNKLIAYQGEETEKVYIGKLKF
jgi:hypothetical protein